MKKVRIFILLGVLVVALATTTVVSATPKLFEPYPCPDPGGTSCEDHCVSPYYGWYCIFTGSMIENPNSTIGDINYYASGCSWSYYAECSGHDCHCMRVGYSDHCKSWNH
jgi:hypothetical protein